MNRDSLVHIDVWLDFICPFSYVELPIFDELKARYGARIALRWHAFEISPEPEPSLNLQLDKMLEVCVQQIFPIALDRGVELRVPTMIPRTRKAFEVAFAARQLGHFEPMQRSIFKAYFQNGVDIGDTEALLDLVESAGMDSTTISKFLRAGSSTADVLSDQKLAVEVGATGVPFSLISKAVDSSQETRIAPIGIHGAAPFEHFEEAFASLYPGGLRQ